MSSGQAPAVVLTSQKNPRIITVLKIPPPRDPELSPLILKSKWTTATRWHQTSQDQKGLVAPGASCQPATQAHPNHFINLAVVVPTIYMTEDFGPHSLYYWWVGESYCLFVLHKMSLYLTTYTVQHLVFSLHLKYCGHHVNSYRFYWTICHCIDHNILNLREWGWVVIHRTKFPGPENQEASKQKPKKVLMAT